MALWLCRCLSRIGYQEPELQRKQQRGTADPDTSDWSGRVYRISRHGTVTEARIRSDWD